MMLSFDHLSKNVNEGAVKKTQKSSGKNLNVEATHRFHPGYHANDMAAFRIWTRKLASVKFTANPMHQ